MKRKIFSILLALMLALSFSLIPALPAAAATPELELGIKAPDAIAEWSTAQVDAGTYSVHLKTGGTGDGNEGRIVIDAASVGITTLSDITSFAWSVYTVAGMPPHVDIYLDVDEDGVVDLEDVLTAEMAYNNPFYAHEVGPGVGPALWFDGDHVNDSYGAWFQTFEATEGDGFGTVNDNTFLWVTKMGSGYDDAPSGTLAQWIAGVVTNDPENEMTTPVISGTTPVVRLEIEVDRWVYDSEAYIDDLTINGVTYDVEWTHVSPIQVDDDKVQYPTAPFHTIQDAIAAATAGDIINVNDGTYEESITVNTGNLTLRSENGRDSTTIENVGNVVGEQCGFLLMAGASNFTLGGAANQGFTLVGGDAGRIIILKDAPSDVEISHNTINSTGEAQHGLSVGAAGATRLTVSNNNFIADLSAPGGSEASFWGEKLVDVTVTWNVFTGTWVGEVDTKWTPAIYFQGVTASSSSVPSTISNNTITLHGRGILLETGESGTSDLLISNNNISSCFVGIKFDDVEGTAITTVTVTENTLTTNDNGIQITTGANITTGSLTIIYNEISGNTTFGLENLAGEDVTAKYNYWGAALDGPTHASNTNGTGDAVSDNVLYSPWLYYTTATNLGNTVANIVANQVPAYAQSVDLTAGWNTFSVPIGLDGQYNNWNELVALTSLPYTVAWRFDSSSQTFLGLPTTSTYAIAPGEGFYVKMTSADSIPYCYSTLFSIPSRSLSAGWSMIGGGMTTQDEIITCVSIATVASTAGYTQIISPAENANSWFWYTGSSSWGDFVLGEGYWVFLPIARTLGLFDLTPVPWVP